MKHLVIVNPKSFSKKTAMDSILRDIGAYFLTTEDEFFIYTSRYPRDAKIVVRDYVKLAGEEVVRIYSVGGDGILYDCLNGIIGLHNAQLAVIPYGTANDFARAFGENKQHILRDIKKQATAGIIPTDIINLGNRCVINFCSVGIEAAVVLKYYGLCKNHPILSHYFGKTFYMAGIPLAFFDKNVTGQRYEVRIDGEVHDGAYLGINFSNGPCYGGDKTPQPNANPADGLMDIMTLSGRVNPQLLVMINQYTKGNYEKYPNYLKHLRAKEISISSQDPLHITADGESYYGSEIKAKIIPAAVNIVAPGGLSYRR